jgi:prepilin-type N-terminal cleavage/methylation domain-containing protein
MSRARRRHAGFTLTELMVVVSIIGILVTMAIVYMRPRVRPIDVAMRVGDLIREASRRAVALGPVRADVALNYKSKARTLILVDQQGTSVTYTLYRLQENPLPDNTGVWQPVQSYSNDKNVLADHWADKVADSTHPAMLTWQSSPPPSTSGFMVSCYPDGTCDSKTLFFCRPVTPGSSTCDTTGPQQELKAKLTILPLGGAIGLRTDWN